MVYRKLIQHLVIVLGLILTSGCTIYELEHTKAKPAKLQREGTVNVAASASGVPDGRVGWGRTIIIPTIPVHIENDASLALVDAVGAALSASGYNNYAGANRVHAIDAGILRVQVNHMYFRNFTLPPIITHSGAIFVQLRLEALDGTLLWQKEVKARAMSWRFWSGFNGAAKKTMNQLVKVMTKTFTERDFYEANKRIKRHNDFIKEKSSAE